MSLPNKKAKTQFAAAAAETPARTPERTPGSVGQFCMYKKQPKPAAPAGTHTVGSLVQKVTEGILVPDKVARGAAVAQMKSVALQQRNAALREENKQREAERDARRAKRKVERANKKKNRR